MRPLRPALVAGSLMLLPLAGPALAGDMFVDGSATIQSDYRFRGLSLSDRRPAANATLTLATSHGLYASVWAGTLDDHNGTDGEVDAILGWTHRTDWADLSAGGIYYAFPGGHGAAAELFADVAVPFGPLRGTLGVNYAPSQRAIGGDNLYVHGRLSAAIPGTALTLHVAGGHEHGGLVTGDSFGRTGKWDWQLGADYGWRGLTFGLAWVGNSLAADQAPSASARTMARNGIVAALSIGF